MLLKCCTQHVFRSLKLSSGHRTEKGQFFIPIPKEGNSIYLFNLFIYFKLESTIKSFIWKPQESPQDGKKSVYIPIPKKGNTKECSNYHTVTLISHASNLVIASVNPSQNPMHKILQAKLQKYLNRELPDVQGGYRKGRGIRDQIANICWIVEKAKEFQKNICFIDYTKAFDCMDHNKVENS